MNRLILAPRRPIRVAATASAAVALLGAVGCLVVGAGPVICPLLAVGYGFLLGGGVVGLLLASHHRVVRWWWGGCWLVFAAKLALGVVASRAPRLFLESDWFLKITLGATVGWLLSGCLLAVWGWWSYFRGPAASDPI